MTDQDREEFRKILREELAALFGRPLVPEVRSDFMERCDRSRKILEEKRGKVSAR